MNRIGWKRFVAEYRRSTGATIAAVVLGLLVLAAMLAPLISPQNPYDLAQLEVMDARLAPGTPSSDGRHTYWLGTDAQGRDMLSAILYGLRISVFVGLSATLLAVVIGIVVGLIAGYFGGRFDALLMRVVDMQLSFPAILVALILIAILGQGTGKVIAALVAAQWAYYARTIRGVVLVERQREYISAARVLALPITSVLFRHLLPNCMPSLIVVGALQVASAIALEATLSFLGVGLPITEPSLGLLISNGFTYLLSGKYWISFFPGLALLATIMSINLVADQLRDVLNPRLRVD
ncbi:MAG TPA: ABC transporter permease [Burkholderiaceae bacterium]|nr:ABC transporter permease [Burkholderiaceae bacterium]